jgi:hypothetical protein
MTEDRQFLHDPKATSHKPAHEDSTIPDAANVLEIPADDVRPLRTGPGSRAVVAPEEPPPATKVPDRA